MAKTPRSPRQQIARPTIDLVLGSLGTLLGMVFVVLGAAGGEWLAVFVGLALLLLTMLVLARRLTPWHRKRPRR